MNALKTAITNSSVGFSLALVFAFPLNSEAKTLYVNGSTGNDSLTYDANSESTPWRTIGRAAWGSTNYTSQNATEAARAGDVVLISAGVYWESGGTERNRYGVALNPANSGTANSPITFRGLGSVYVRLQQGIRGPMIGCANNRSYIIWDHLTIDDYYGGSTSDTGPVVIVGSHHCQIINSEIMGHPGTYYHGYETFGGNYVGVRMDYANFNLVRNNRIHRITGGQNEAGIMLYDSSDNTMEHNEIYQNGIGIFVKGVHPGQAQDRNIIRYNYVHDNSIGGIRVLDGYLTKVYQNIVTNNNYGLWAGFSRSNSSRFINNVVYNNRQGNLILQGTALVDVHFKNNIVANGQAGMYNWDADNPSVQDLTFDRNLYHNLTEQHAIWNADGNRQHINFSTWQNTYRHDLNGITNNPLFIDASANDFHLQGGSPALTLGRVADGIGGNNGAIIPAGAYITGNEVIGLLRGAPGSGDAVAPSPPANVQITQN